MKRRILEAYGLMMMAASIGVAMPHDTKFNKIQDRLTPEEFERVKQKRAKKDLERKLNRGLTEWKIDGIIVVALNYKNALRKVNNLKKALEEIEI